MAKQHAVSDATLTKALAVYAGMVRQILSNPHRWLGSDREPSADASLPVRVIDAVRDWRHSARPLQARPSGPISHYLSVSTGGLTESPWSAAYPRPRPDSPVRSPTECRFKRPSAHPAAGIAICAVAREHGKTSADEWIPLLARVLFNRELAPQAAPVPDPEESEEQLENAAADTSEPPSTMAVLSEVDSGRADAMAARPHSSQYR